MSKDKLTAAQKALLLEVANGDDGCSDAYRPAQKLVRDGLLRWRAESRLALTDAGRAMLEGSDAE